MIGPIGATLIQRTAPAARVRRKDKGRAAKGDVAETFEERLDRRAPSIAPMKADAGRPASRKVTPGVFAALLKLKLGGS